jgi:small subunit ribosomal protein S6
MAEYEIVLVVDPRLSDDEFATLSSEFKQLLAGLGAELTKEESWGKRKLAYPIAKQSEGRYHVYQLCSEKPIAVSQFESRLVQNEHVLRYLTVRADEGRLRRRGDGAGVEGSEGGEAAAVGTEESGS